MKFNSLKLLRLRFSIRTYQASGFCLFFFNYDEYLPRTSIFWYLGRISLILDFTSLGATMFAKVAQTLFQHFSEKLKTFGLLCFDLYLPRVSGFWTLVKDFVDT